MPEDLQAAPASVQVILHELAVRAPLTGKQIREATGLPRRTVYTALRRLRAMGVLLERSSLKDTRQTYFWLAGEAKAQEAAIHHHEQQPDGVPA